MKFSLLRLPLIALATWGVFVVNSAFSAELRFDSPHTFYANKDIVLNIKSDGLNGKRLSWNLKYAGRSIAAGEQEIPSTGTTEVKFHFPELKAGVIAATEFNCFSGETKLQNDLFFFHPNPFANETAFFNEQKIGVFQPDDSKSISALLESYGIKSLKLSSIGGFDGKILIVSGINFSGNPGFFESLLNLSQKEIRVIIMSPISGTISLKSESIGRILLAGTDIIPEFNKKYDSYTWNGKQIEETSFKTVPFDGGIALEFVKEKERFSYCEIRSSNSKGKLIICGFNIGGLADESPSPAYLFRNLLKSD